MPITTVGTPIVRSRTVTSTDTSTTTSRGACVATHAAIWAIRSRRPGWPDGAQCNAPPAVGIRARRGRIVVAGELQPGSAPAVGSRARAEPRDRLAAEPVGDRGGTGDVPVALVMDVVADHVTGAAASVVVELDVSVDHRVDRARAIACRRAAARESLRRRAERRGERSDVARGHQAPAILGEQLRQRAAREARRPASRTRAPRPRRGRTAHPSRASRAPRTPRPGSARAPRG